MNKTKDLNKEYFLDDRPIENLQEEDAFGHLYYAKALLQILEKSPEGSSESIGLFGQWGVGKTSIINELAKMLRRSGPYSDQSLNLKYQVVIVDTWQYSQDNFRREFLLDLAEELDCQEEIKKRLTQSEETTTMRAPKITWRLVLGSLEQIALLLLSAFAAAGIAYLAASALLGLTNIPEDIQDQLTVLVALLFGIPAVFIQNIKSSLSFQPVVEQAQPAVHADEFRDLFEFIVTKKAKLKGDDRLVVVLDNLDRVAEEIVLEVLASVKTFLDRNRCIYILPCDHEGLKHHIRSSRAGSGFEDGFSNIQATEYLRKFFKTTLTVREFLTEDLQQYITDVLARMKIFDLGVAMDGEGSAEQEAEIKTRNRQGVATVFRVAAAKDPRRIIQLANKLTANYLLAVQKKTIDPQLFANISKNLGFLAKLTVLEERWPSYHGLIVQYPQIVKAVSDELITGAPEAPPSLLERYVGSNPSLVNSLLQEWNSGLRQFLQGTNFIAAPHVSDFVHFRQRPSTGRISDFYRFRDALVNANSADIGEILDDESTQIDAAVATALRELTLYSGLGDQSTVANISLGLIQIFEAAPGGEDSHREELANELAGVLSRDGFASIATRLEANKLLNVLAAVHESRRLNRSAILNRLCSGLDFAEQAESSGVRLQALLENNSMMSSAQYQRIRSRIKGATDSPENMHDLRDAARLVLSETPSQVKQMVPQELLVKNIELLGTSDPGSSDAAEFLKDFLAYMTKGTGESYASRLSELLSNPTEPPRNSYLQTLQIVIRHAGAGLTASQLDEIVAHLAHGFTTFAAQENKDLAVRAYLAVLSSIGEEGQRKFGAAIATAIASANPQLLMEIIQSTQANLEKIANVEQMIEKIRARSATHHADKGVRVAFFQLASSAGAEAEIGEYLRNLGGNHNAIMQSLDDARSVLSDEALMPLLKTALEQAHELADPHLEPTLTAIGGFAERFTESYISDVTELLLNRWLFDDRESARLAAIALWDTFKTKASPADKSKFYGRTLEKASEHISGSTIAQPPNRLYLEILRDNFRDLPSDTKTGYVDLLVKARELGRENQVREVGYAFIGTLDEDAFSNSPCFKELMDDLEAESDPGQLKNIVEALTKHKDHLQPKDAIAVRAFLDSGDANEVLKPYAEVWKES